ncbi:hypothetical protein LCGC14_3133590 [marine sediment metagenome]|uniref:Uncharacterized protein n=1 Tax=marine sediment metagenome TaxID=412755 RepID=A0A0F8Y5Z4_9ZZZZ
MMGYMFCKKNPDGTFNLGGTWADPYIYLEDPMDTLNIQHLEVQSGLIKPIMWAQNGRYGWISKEQVLNMIRRQEDLAKQQKGYAKDKPVKLVFHWDDVVELDPYTVKAIRKISQ